MIQHFEAILSNPIVTGLSTTAVLGAIAFQLRSLPKTAWSAFLRLCTVKLTVDSRDPTFVWVNKWLSAQPYASRSHVVTLRSGEHDPSQEQAQWMLAPGYGSHIFWWRSRLIVVNRGYKDIKSEAKDAIEEISFHTIGRSQGVLRQMVGEAQDIANKKDLVGIRLWRGWWAFVAGKSPRKPDTLILREGQMERLLKDIEWFGKAKDWYISRGIPYRRGYLFSGPPGTGKTSIVLTLASHVNRPVCVLNLGSVKDDAQLFAAMVEAPQNGILLIEDIDCAQPSQTREGKSNEMEPQSGVTKAGLLNALDGVTSPEGRVVIMTTNYAERLDAALIRPGRADVVEEFRWLEVEDQVRMARRFYGDVDFKPLEAPIAPAAMQAAFMKHPYDHEAAREELC